MFLTAGLEPRVWNRDVSKAFRRCLISVEHLDLSWVVSAAEGLDGVSQHLGPLFGASSAAYAWHRFGTLWPGWSWHLSIPIRSFFRCGFFWTGGKLREALGLASGFPMDPEKSVDYSLLMGAFGIEVHFQSARN